ncbi:NAD(P)-dependent alcohol dehydrogenase [Euzebya pacifica]|uniref:NAD(P)-dependent alcohol dehydrogenase n=1 Tax=Euzebya pacifica TaxID=1608957 RepID=UPI0030F606BA
MRALQLTGWKTDAELVDVPEPEPGPGQVVVRIGGSGACHSDLHLMHEFEAGVVPWGPPFTLGHENAGWVETVGAGVTGLSHGDPVAVYGPWGCGRCHRCRTGAENYCERAADIGAAGGGLGLDGGMAPLMLVPDPRLLVPIGDLDPVAAAPLTDAGLTTYHAVNRSRHLLGAGSTAVVIGAGGLGHMAVQFLKVLSSATVIAVDTRQEALQLAAEVGADHGVLAGEDAAAEVMELTGGRGAEVVLDVVGVDTTLALAAAVTRSLGHLTIVGIGGGTLPVNFFSVGYEVSVATTYWGTLPELMEVMTLADAGLVSSHVQTFDLDDAPKAYESMQAGTLTGRAVIVPVAT